MHLQLVSKLITILFSVYTIASSLDPRFKTRFFNAAVSAAVIEEVKSKLVAMTEQQAPTNDGDRLETAEQPASKKPRLAAAHTSLFDCLDDLLEAANTQDSEATQSTSTARANVGSLELDRYLAEPLLPRTGNLSQWWKDNKERYPVLASLARTYLAAPPSSVPSERLFSTAGAVITDQRSRLLPENAERLIFLKYNSNLI